MYWIINPDTENNFYVTYISWNKLRINFLKYASTSDIVLIGCEIVVTSLGEVEGAV